MRNVKSVVWFWNSLWDSEAYKTCGVSSTLPDFLSISNLRILILECI